MITKAIKTFGRYCLFLTQVFRSPDKWKVFFKQLVTEISQLGVDSIPLVVIISVFIGAVIAIQMTIN
ncbi:MAG: ABC transporter permease, partial [Muribaculaceae bacterium]|nr:ABC transporter permease [Muribaculaceae bacterium]